MLGDQPKASDLFKDVFPTGHDSDVNEGSEFMISTADQAGNIIWVMEKYLSNMSTVKQSNSQTCLKPYANRNYP